MIGHGEDLGCQPEGSTACLTVHACLNHWLGCLPGNVWRPHLPLFSSEGNLGQRIFCSLLEMHQPWSSRIKMIQCFKIYRTLLDYVGLFCFVCFAVLNFGLVQESPCWELTYCVIFHIQLIIHTYDWHWLNNCSSLLFLFVCFHAQSYIPSWWTHSFLQLVCMSCVLMDF